MTTLTALITKLSEAGCGWTRFPECTHRAKTEQLARRLAALKAMADG